MEIYVFQLTRKRLKILAFNKAGWFKKEGFDSPVHYYFVTLLLGHSFNTAFTNCENVKCIILWFINTFLMGINSKLECDVIISKKAVAGL